MTDLEKIETQIESLKVEREKLIKSKTVTIGQLLDIIDAGYNNDSFSKAYFLNNLELALRELGVKL